MSTIIERSETEGAFEARPEPHSRSGQVVLTFADRAGAGAHTLHEWTMSRREAIDTAVELLVAASVDPEVVETVQVSA